MALSAKAGSFSKATVTGNQAITGVGFTPKAIIFIGSNGSVAGTVEATYAREFMGFVAGTTPSTQTIAHCMAANTKGSGGASGGVAQGPHAIIIGNQSGTSVDVADIVSFDSDGFTINWTTNSGGSQIIGYLCLGGADLTNVATFSYTKPTSTTNVAVTGLGFKPDGLIIVGPNGNTGYPTASAGGAGFNIGAVDSALHMWAHAYFQNPSNPSQDAQAVRNDVARMTVNNLGTVSASGSIASLDTDGFTDHPVTSSATAAVQIGIAFKGIQLYANGFGKSTSGAPVAQDFTGGGFTPRAALLVGNNQTSVNSTSASTDRPSLGLTDGTNHVTIEASFADNNAAPTGRSLTKTDKSLTISSNEGISTLSEAVVSIILNGLRFTWNPNTASVNRISYLAFGDGVASYVPPVETIQIALMG